MKKLSIVDLIALWLSVVGAAIAGIYCLINSQFNGLVFLGYSVVAAIRTLTYGRE